MYNFLKSREIGMKPRLGDETNLWKTLYTSIAMFDKGTIEYGGIFNLEFSPDGSILVAATERKSVLVYDPITYSEIGVLKMAHNDCVNCVKFLDERIFATCSDDSTVALWDTRNMKKVIRRLRGHSNWVKNIEYAKEEGLLVTSGFDGSIFTWNINSYTEEGLVYEKVFHTSGLMRCRLTPKADRLVISTTGGYLIIVHDLDLKTLALDLSGFRPNIYRLMQMGRQLLPTAVKYNHLFVRKRNRVELVSDFPLRNDAEVISSLQIHPQGWCALSRNVSYDESSEWTCVHDIQSGPRSEILVSRESDGEDSDDIESESMNPRWQPPTSSLAGRRVLAADPNEVPLTHRRQPNVNTFGITPHSYADVWVAEISMHHRFDGNFDNAVIYGINSGISAAQAMLLTQQENSARTGEESSDPTPSAAPSAPRPTPACTLRPQRDESGREPRIVYQIPDSLRKIQMNTKHMLYYVEEPNKGRGFIKELCFSHDGRIICSPYDRGVRLLAFNKDCAELPETLELDGTPKVLTDLMRAEHHPDIVISSKFSPREPLLVSGCLQGELVWYKPIL